MDVQDPLSRLGPLPRQAEDPVSGHAAGQIVYVDWPGWAGRAREEGGPGATALSFTADKPSYKVGEKAVIFLPEAVQGRALVSIESGTSVLDMMWVPTVKGENRFEIPLTAAMTPNVYVHVTLLQPHRDKTSDAPIRLYGVIPLLVEDPATKLEPCDQGGRRDPAQGEVQGRGPRERRPADDLHAGRRRRGPARPDPVRDARPAQGLLQPRGPRRPDLGPLRSSWPRPTGPRWPASWPSAATRAPIPRTRPSSRAGFPPVVLFEGPFELKAGASGRPRVDDAAVFRGGPGHGRGRSGRRVRLGGEVRAGPPRPDDPGHAAAGRAPRRGRGHAGHGLRRRGQGQGGHGLRRDQRPVRGRRRARQDRRLRQARRPDRHLRPQVDGRHRDGRGPLPRRGRRRADRGRDQHPGPGLERPHHPDDPSRDRSGQDRQPGGRAVRIGEHERRHCGGVVPAAAQPREEARLSHPVSPRLPRADALGGLSPALPEEPGQARRRAEARGRGECQGGRPEADGVPDDQRSLLVLAGGAGGARVDERLRRLLPARGGPVRLSRAPGHARRLAGQSEAARQRLRHERRFGQAHPGLPAVRAGPGPRSGPRGHEPAPRERRASRPGRD
ncbi:MAG: hypothetical protein MZV64_12845 [Ignavibacteriales bacterium]|nr:hypothetical protein [Ignavibacteriales bacterium]